MPEQNLTDSPTLFPSLQAFAQAAGQHLGHSPWVRVTQEQVNLFADATDDHQWIHVDPERAANGPFGATIAHGFLSLSLLPSFLRQIYTVQGLRMGVNYGLNKVRFPAPVKVGAKLRAGAELVSAEPTERGLLSTIKVTVEAKDVPAPVCVAEFLTLQA